MIFLVALKSDLETLVDQALASPEKRIRRVMDGRRLPTTSDCGSLPPETDLATAGEALKEEIILEIWEEWFRLTISFRHPKRAAKEIYFFQKQCWFLTLVLWGINTEKTPGLDLARPTFFIAPPAWTPQPEAVKMATQFLCLEGHEALIDDDWKEILCDVVAKIFGFQDPYEDRVTGRMRFVIDQSVWDEMNRVCEEGMVCEGGMSDLP